jgi:rhodanese-related sulfurtransferase
MQKVDAEQVKQLIETTPVYDVRGDEDFRTEHIPGAKSAPLGGLETRVGEVLNRDSEVIVYSNDADCPLSRQAAERLEALGFTQVRRFEHGIRGWKDSGFEVSGS